MTDAYIFGEIIKNFDPQPAVLEEIIQKSKAKKKKIASVPVTAILNILDDVSRAWADPEYSLRKIAYEYLKQQTGYCDEMLEIGFQTISYICSKNFLYSRIKTELNCEFAFEKLERISSDPKSGGMIKICPLGNVLHVSASNVFISAVDSLVSGFVTGNVNFLKLSRSDLLFPILFSKSILEFDSESLISDCFSVFYYKGGDNLAERAISGAMDAIVVWGGADAVAAWRREAPSSARLIEYGPKISFSLIDLKTVYNEAQLDELCAGLACDISSWEQAACSSPQNVFVIASDTIDCDKFAFRLFRALKNKEKQLPSKELSLDEQIEILKFREKYHAAFIAGENARIFYESDVSPCGVAISNFTECEPSVLFRNIIIKSINSLDEFYSAIDKISFYLQAVSIRIGPDDIYNAAGRIMQSGVNRVLLPGRHAEPFQGAPHDAKYLLNDLVRYASFEIGGLSRNALLFKGRTDDALCGALKNILREAYYNVKYYNGIIDPEIFKLGGAAFFDAFNEVPMLGKKEIYENCLPDSLNIISSAGLSGCHIFASGGSTGEAKFSVYSNDELEYVTNVLADIYRIAKIEPDMRVANLFIAGGLWTSFIVANMALEKIGVTNLSMGGNTDFPTLLKFFKKLRPDAIVGLPSIIIKFAEYCEKENAGIKAGLILYGGEHLRPPAREYLKKVFGVSDILSAGYAAVDCGPIGFQCPCQNGAFHHVLDDYQFVEFIKADGSPARPGESGEIVVTNLNRTRMPVIRFRTGDMASLSVERCECGRTGKVFELLGRCDDILVAGGANLTPRDFEEAISIFQELSTIFQIMACTKNQFDALELFVELKEGVLIDNGRREFIRSALIDELKRRSFKIKTMLESGWLDSFNVFIVNAGLIERIGRTGKVLNIKDLRSK